ncbi:MAG: hypothetical protein Q9197_001707 [Variospora fuerteventurae]
MAYGIKGSFRDSHIFIYQTTRSVKCVYFDGESASMMNGGQLDTQMLHIYGNVTGPPKQHKHNPNFLGEFIKEEYDRAIRLCGWLCTNGLGGPGWGYEGIVRMNAGFEMIWCNFTSPSLRLVSRLNVTAPLLPPDGEKEQDFAEDLQPDRSAGSSDARQASLPPPLNREPFMCSKFWLWFSSGTKHYGSSADGPGLGEARIRLSTCGFLNYYAPEFISPAESRISEERRRLNLSNEGYWEGVGKDAWRSEALKSLARRRRLHGLEAVTVSDAALMRERSEKVLRNLSQSPPACSGIDWHLVTNEIVRTYAEPLNVLRESFRKRERLSEGKQPALRDFAAGIREQTHGLLVPFLEYPRELADVRDWSRGSRLFNETHTRCTFQHTLVLNSAKAMDLSLEEWSLKWATEETLDSICSVLVAIGLSAEGLWQAHFNSEMAAVTDISMSDRLNWHFSNWAQGVEELMAWLGWEGEWTRCEQKCAISERCFIPMAPFIPLRSVPPKTWMDRRGRGDPAWPDLPLNETTLWNPICVKADYIAHLNAVWLL